MFRKFSLRVAFTAFLISLFALLSGCAATSVAISKRNLDVQTKMSNSIFLDPVAKSKRTVFVQVRNTTDKPGLSIENDLRSAIAAKGYAIQDDPDRAYYVLQVNLLQAGKADPAAAQQALANGFGGAVTGVLIAASAGGDSRGGALGAVVGGIVETVSGALVKDVTYSVITDIQLSERRFGAGKATVMTNNTLQQGIGGTTTVSHSRTSDKARYQTRVLSMANKVNLEFEEAQPSLISGLATSISGIF